MPDAVRPGASAPWLGAPGARRSGFTLEVVGAQLRAAKRTFDGDGVSMGYESAGDLGATSPNAARRSAVLVALYEVDGEAHVVLTRRARAMAHHGGEIAFPGGRSEPGESPLATALREASEEVNLDPASATAIAWLTPLATFATKSAIYPIVVTLGKAPNLVANPAEVDDVFALALRDLVAEGNFVEERWRHRDLRPGADGDGFVAIHFYRAPHDLIWGATARVLSELLGYVTGVTWPAAEGVAANSPE